MTTTRIQINLQKGQADFVHILIWIYAANGQTVDRLLLREKYDQEMLKSQTSDQPTVP